MIAAEACEVLGVTATATETEIKQAYRRLVLIAHPDRGGSSEAFIQVNEAYEILTGQRKATFSDTSQHGQSSSSARRSRQTNFTVANAAMTMLNLDPDEFTQIERACYTWLGGVSDLNKRAAKQLLWLAVGRLPVGAAVSVAKGQRYKHAAKRMLDALQDVSSSTGISSPSSWSHFADAYVSMLKLSGMKSAKRDFDAEKFLNALIDIELKSRSTRPNGQY